MQVLAAALFTTPGAATWHEQAGVEQQAAMAVLLAEQQQRHALAHSPTPLSGLISVVWGTRLYREHACAQMMRLFADARAGKDAAAAAWVAGASARTTSRAASPPPPTPAAALPAAPPLTPLATAVAELDDGARRRSTEIDGTAAAQMAGAESFASEVAAEGSASVPVTVEAGGATAAAAAVEPPTTAPHPPRSGRPASRERRSLVDGHGGVGDALLQYLLDAIPAPSRGNGGGGNGGNGGGGNGGAAEATSLPNLEFGSEEHPPVHSIIAAWASADRQLAETLRAYMSVHDARPAAVASLLAHPLSHHYLRQFVFASAGSLDGTGNHLDGTDASSGVAARGGSSGARALGDAAPLLVQCMKLWTALQPTASLVRIMVPHGKTTLPTPAQIPQLASRLAEILRDRDRDRETAASPPSVPVAAAAAAAAAAVVDTGTGPMTPTASSLPQSPPQSPKAGEGSGAAAGTTTAVPGEEVPRSGGGGGAFDGSSAAAGAWTAEARQALQLLCKGRCGKGTDPKLGLLLEDGGGIGAAANVSAAAPGAVPGGEGGGPDAMSAESVGVGTALSASLTATAATPAAVAEADAALRPDGIGSLDTVDEAAPATLAAATLAPATHTAVPALAAATTAPSDSSLPNLGSSLPNLGSSLPPSLPHRVDTATLVRRACEQVIASNCLRLRLTESDCI
jgi:hypothetical protein